MSNKIQTLSKGSQSAMSEAIRKSRILTPQGSQGANGPPIGIWYWGKLTTALAAPVDGMAAPTHATFDIWLPDGLTSPPGVTLIRSADTQQQGLTVYNRFTGLSASIATIIQVEFGWGEWFLKGSDC